MYNGNWLDNCMHGYGVYSWKDGRRYEGEYIKDKKHGKGKYVWANGKVYDGMWEDGKQHGEGEFYNPSTDETKKGRWEHGKRMAWVEGNDTEA